MTPQYRDFPARGLAWVTSVLSTAAFAAAGGFAFGFLALVFVGVAGVELDPMVWGSGVLDQMLRGTVGLAGIGFAVCLGLGAAFLGAFRLAYARQLAREAESDATRVAAWQSREVIHIVSPFMVVNAFAGWLIGLGTVAVVLLIAVGAQSSGDRSGLGIALGIASAVVVGMIGLLVLVSNVWKPAWYAAVLRVQTAWGNRVAQEPSPEAEEGTEDDARSVGSAARRLKRVARVITRASLVAGLVGAAAFMIGLVMRQPCRNCDQLSYDARGEAAIDVLMSIAVPFTAVALAALVLGLLIEWIEDVVIQARLASLARDGAPAPAEHVLATALTSAWPGRTAGAALAVVGLGIGGVFGFAGTVVPGILPPEVAPALLAIGVVGVLVIGWSVGAEARSLNRLREAWSVGDVRPPPAKRAKRSTVSAPETPGRDPEP